MDFSLIQSVLLSEMRATNIYSLTVLGPENSAIFVGMVRDEAWRPIASKSPPAPGGRVFATAVIQRKGDNLGRVEVCLASRFYEADRKSFLNVTAATILLVDLAIVALLFLILRRLLVIPMQTIQGYAARVSSGTNGLYGINRVVSGRACGVEVPPGEDGSGALVSD